LLLVMAGLGALSALAHAPYHIQPALILGLVILVLTLDDARATGAPLRAGFARAWAFGFGQFLAGTFWVANAFLVSAQDHAWLIWAPLTLLPGGLALFWGLAGAIYARLRVRGPARIAVFAAAFLAVEALRSVILSGFPWNLPGHVFEAGAPVSQIASLIGALGLSALTLYAFAAPAALFGRGPALTRAFPLMIAGLALGAAWIWGGARLAAAEIEPLDVRLRIVQLDRDQTQLRPEARAEILAEYLDLTTQPGLADADLVIWPEGAIPAYLLNEPALLQRIHDALPAGKRLVVGAPHVVWGPDGAPQSFHNALHALRVATDALVVEARYDKAKLVPFGEANTLAALTRPFGLETLSQYGIGFDPGPGAQTLALGDLPPFAPLICYEVIYPRYTLRANNRPAWLLNISNDSWYGHSAGPAQLLNQAAYRSIEDGLPLVRSATAGMSGLIDPYGRVVQIASVEESQVLDLVLLASLDEPFYGRHGDGPWLITFVILIGLAQFLPVLASKRV
jgi:apolipoprotein N-acyltransferase